jgi:tetratricopeptide (TPR) repeat protein
VTGYRSYERGDLQGAIRQYRAALSLARKADEPEAIADGARNLGACLLEANRPEAALGYLEEAGAEARRAGSSGLDAVLLQAKARRVLGQRARATTLLDGVLSNRAAHASQRALAAAVRADIALELGDPAAARAWTLQARRHAAAAADSLSLAAAAEAEGRLLLHEGSPEEAARAFDEQSRLLKQGGAYAEMASALSRASRAFLLAGQPGPAADRAYRAARSFLGQERPRSALQALAAGRQALESDPETRDLYGVRIQFLAEEIEALTR